MINGITRDLLGLDEQGHFGVLREQKGMSPAACVIMAEYHAKAAHDGHLEMAVDGAKMLQDLLQSNEDVKLFLKNAAAFVANQTQISLAFSALAQAKVAELTASILSESDDVESAESARRSRSVPDA